MDPNIQAAMEAYKASVEKRVYDPDFYWKQWLEETGGIRADAKVFYATFCTAWVWRAATHLGERDFKIGKRRASECCDKWETLVRPSEDQYWPQKSVVRDFISGYIYGWVMGKANVIASQSSDEDQYLYNYKDSEISWSLFMTDIPIRYREHLKNNEVFLKQIKKKYKDIYNSYSP